MINYSDIKNFASNNAVYSRGEDYFFSGHIISLKSTDDFGLNWEGRVAGTAADYDVTVGLDKNSHIIDYRCHCNCKAFTQYSGACKHIIAVLLKLRELQENNSIIPEKKNEFTFQTEKNRTEKYKDVDIKNMFDKLFKEKPSEPKKSEARGRSRGNGDVRAVELLMQDYRTLEKSNYNKELLEINFDLILTKFDPYIEYKVGYLNKHKYVVKDINFFTTALRREGIFELGKNLTCDFKKDQFDEKSKKIINFMFYCSDKEKNLKNIIKGNFFNSYLYSGKKQFLLPEDLRKLFNMYENEEISIKTDVTSYAKSQSVFIKKGLPDIDFYLSKENDQLILNTEGEQIWDFDTLADSGIYIQGDTAYLTEEQDNKFLRPLFKINQLNISDFKIPKSNEDTFINNVIPNIVNKSNFYLPKSIVYEENHHKMEAKIYIEAQAQHLILYIHFCYGNSVFSLDGTPLTNENKIQKIDHSKESGVIDFFHRYRLNYADKTESTEAHFIMNIEQDIYDFLFKGIDELKEIATVYTDKKIDFSRSRKNFSMNVSLEDDYLNINFEMEDMTPEEMEELYHSYRIKKQFYRLKNGGFVDFEDEELKKQLDSMDKIFSENSKFSSKTTLPQYKSFYVDLLGTEYFNDGYKKSESLEKYIKKIKNLNVGKYDDSLLENVKLRDYQRFGVQWLESLAQINLGGILADDMGLGKTLQVIALLTKAKLSSPALIIVPKTLLYNWEEEFKKFSPKLKLLIVEGSIAARKKLLKRAEEYDIVITSYSLFRSDINIYEKYMFSFCFLDEAQHIKNPAINLTKAIKSVNAKHRFALTGTPIENNLSELWSIFDFIMPGYLGSHGYFSKNFMSPIMKQNDKSALEALSFHIKPFILRRIKKDVLLELPPKIETTQLCELDINQKKLYQSQLEVAKKEIEDEIKNEKLSKSQIKIFSLLTRLRQICCHPKLFIDNYTHSSGKFETLFELFDDLISGNHKTLVFSQFTTMLKLISSELKEKGVEHYYLDGSMKARDRLELVNSFNSGNVPIFLISLKAGGTGLNLTSSDTVIHVDPWWNPSVENQASDRSHRIGQKNSVQVIKLITKGTIEEKIMKLQNKKKELIDNVLTSEGSLINTLSEEDIKNLFDI
jgi:SNF2 family DNA or RNA helicase